MSIFLYRYYRNVDGEGNNEDNLKNIILGVVFAGLLCIIWSAYNIDKHDDNCHHGMILFFATLSNIGQALVAGALFAYIFELSQFKQYFERTVTAIITGKDYLREQEVSKLKKFRSNVTEAWYEISTKKVDKSLIDLDNKISELLTSPYYKSYNESFKCEIDTTKDIITKHVSGSIIIENPGIKAVDMLDIFEDTAHFMSLDPIPDEEIRVLTNFQVKKDDEVKFSKNLSDQIEIGIEKNPNARYSLKTSFEPIGTKDQKSEFAQKFLTENVIHIKWSEIRKVPISDLTYSFTMKRPTKYLSFNYNITGSKDFIIRAHCFGTLASVVDGNIEIDNNNSQSVSLRCHKWLLNGNGAVFFMDK